MTNQILDEDFTPITLEKLRFKGKLYSKKLIYDKRVEYLQKMRILMFVVAGLIFIPVLMSILIGEIGFYLFIQPIILGFIFLVGGF